MIRVIWPENAFESDSPAAAVVAALNARHVGDCIRCGREVTIGTEAKVERSNDQLLVVCNRCCAELLA